MLMYRGSTVMQCITGVTHPYLHNQHQYEGKDERGIEVGDVESRSQAPDECVSSDHGCQKQCGQLRTETLNENTSNITIQYVPLIVTASGPGKIVTISSVSL